jgi:hypothetical protein
MGTAGCKAAHSPSASPVETPLPEPNLVYCEISMALPQVKV